MKKTDDSFDFGRWPQSYISSSDDEYDDEEFDYEPSRSGFCKKEIMLIAHEKN